jgi:transketolase C-terminal domain/subunit
LKRLAIKDSDIRTRVMRTPSAVLYDGDYRFELDKGQILRESPEDRAVINGYIFQNLLKLLYRRRKPGGSLDRVMTINTLDAAGRPRFIHSGTYEELTRAFGLAPRLIADAIRARLDG